MIGNKYLRTQNAMLVKALITAIAANMQQPSSNYIQYYPD